MRCVDLFDMFVLNSLIYSTCLLSILQTLGINATEAELANSLAAYTGFVKVSNIFSYIKVGTRTESA